MKTLAMWTVWSQVIEHLSFVNVFQKSFNSNLLVFGFFILKKLKPTHKQKTQLPPKKTPQIKTFSH